MKHERIRANGVTLHAVTDGPEDGPLVILLHGFPDFWYGFRRQIAFLAERGYRVIAPDQRGYNESDKPRGLSAYRVRELAADVVALIDGAGRQKAHVVGHDWGGGVTWMMGVLHPERVETLAVLNAPHPLVMVRTLTSSLDQARRSWYMAFFQLPLLPELFFTRTPRKAFEAIAGEAAAGAFTEEDFEQYRRAWTQPGAATGSIHWYRAAVRRPERLPTAEEARIRAPLLLVWGTGERHLVRSMAEDSMAFCDRGRLELIEGASHWVKDDAPERVNALLEEHLGAHR